MKTLLKIVFCLLLISVVSCDRKNVFDEYKSVGNSWHKDSTIAFDVPKLDATKQYNLFVNVRDNADYPYSNLFLIVSLEQPNKQVKVDTLEFQMANPDGTLLGEGFSDIKESKLVYKLNESFKLKGKYKIKIQQSVRETGKITGDVLLKGITEVGFRIESLN